MNSLLTKVRKYRRMADLAARNQGTKYDKYLTLYWRYHFRAYGKPQPLWGEPVPTGKPPK